jgi:hypothetical protein
VDECRIDDGAAVAHALQPVDDIGHVHNLALEEVADAVSAFEQVDRRLDLDVRDSGTRTRMR